MVRVFCQQPYFLPWLGFLCKLTHASVYVALDDARYRRQHVSRVAIRRSDGQKQWLKIPISGSQNTKMNELKLPSNSSYVERLLKILSYSYGRASFFNSEYPFIVDLLQSNLANSTSKCLSEANLNIIKDTLQYLEISAPLILKASEIVPPLERTQRMITICQQVGAEGILCGDGMARTVHDIKRLHKNGIHYISMGCLADHPVYKQVHSVRYNRSFVSGLSFVDALLNIGPELTRSLIINWRNTKLET